MIACTTYLCLSVLYGHIIIYHIPNTYNYIYVVVSSQSDLYDAADYCISGTYWMQMTTVLLWHMTFLLMTTAILLRAEFSNVLQRYSLTYSITYMFIVLYMESMLFSRLLYYCIYIFPPSYYLFPFIMQIEDCIEDSKKSNDVWHNFCSRKVVFFSERDEEILMVHVKNPIRILNVGTESFEWFSE